MKELIVSDLDGTLLNSRRELSEKTIKTVNGLVNDGLNFTIATARSIHSAREIIKPLDLRLPLVVHNGVFIYDPEKNEDIISVFMEKGDAAAVLELYNDRGVSPIVYTVDENLEKRAYYTGIYSPGEELYLQDRFSKRDKRFRLVKDPAVSLEDKIVAILLIGEKEIVDPLCEEVGNHLDLTVHHAVDIYSGSTWLELNHRNANKKEAVKKLKKILNAEQLLCFGDHLNDIPMFEVADKKYAVKNAHEHLKEIATGVIESNDDDGVARFLELYSSS